MTDKDAVPAILRALEEACTRALPQQIRDSLPRLLHRIGYNRSHRLKPPR